VPIENRPAGLYRAAGPFCSTSSPAGGEGILMWCSVFGAVAMAVPSTLADYSSSFAR
jgi:hypothetical protein